jgi:hypothetical protein
MVFTHVIRRMRNEAILACSISFLDSLPFLLPLLLVFCCAFVLLLAFFSTDVRFNNVIQQT